MKHTNNSTQVIIFPNIQSILHVQNVIFETDNVELSKALPRAKKLVHRIVERQYMQALMS